MKETVQINASSKISLGTVAQQGMCPPFLQQEIFGLEKTLGPSQGVGSLENSARDLGDCTRDWSIPGNARAGRTRSCYCVLALLFPCQLVARAHTPRAISHLFPCS